jgi:peptide/nickel transport system permease protein
MRRAIEKLTFLLLSFAIASVASFALLARITDRGAPTRASLPLLVNARPHDVRDLALAAVREVAAGGAGAPNAARELARLGGAALPHVLPLLETLDPLARGRMGVVSEDDLASPEHAIVFFTRYWQDRAADFRSAGVRRKVQRLAEHALPLRRKEVIELDTFALGELFDAIGHVESGADVKRIERLGPVLTHITGVSLPLPPEPSVAQAAKVATLWRDWAFDHGADFTTLDGPGRLAAMVLETRYFRFLASLPRTLRREDPSGRERLDAVLVGARSTLPVAFVSLLLAAAASALASRFFGQRVELAPKVLLAAPLAAGVPLSVLAVRGTAFGVYGVVLLLALGLSALLLVELGTERGGTAQLRRAAVRAGALLPYALAVVLAADAVLDRGLGALTERALRAHDLEALVWIAWLLSATTSLCILLPSARAGAARHDGAGGLVPARRRGPAIAGSTAVVVGLGTLGALGSMAGSGLGIGHATAMTLLTTGAALVTAGAVASVLGLLAGGISRSSDALLARAVDIAYALPEPLIACSAFTFGPLMGGALIGVLRGIEVGHVLRLRLAEQRALQGVEPPSLGRAPLSPYLRRVLPSAIAPAATALALTASWLAALEGAGARLGAPTSGSLATLAVSSSGTALFTTLLLFALSAALVLLARELSPTPTSSETPGPPVVLALKRRIDSTRPPSSAPPSRPPSEPPGSNKPGPPA